MLKIDVEGGGVGVFQGAQRTIARYRPLIIAELETAGQLEPVQALLQPYGYRTLGPYCDTPTYIFTAQRSTHPLRRGGYRYWRSFRKGTIRRWIDAFKRCLPLFGQSSSRA